MGTRLRPACEVTVDFLEISDAEGHKYYLGRGAQLPAWVEDEQVQALVEAGTVVRYEVI